MKSSRKERFGPGWGWGCSGERISAVHGETAGDKWRDRGQGTTHGPRRVGRGKFSPGESPPKISPGNRRWSIPTAPGDTPRRVHRRRSSRGATCFGRGTDRPSRSPGRLVGRGQGGNPATGEWPRLWERPQRAWPASCAARRECPRWRCWAGAWLVADCPRGAGVSREFPRDIS